MTQSFFHKLSPKGALQDSTLLRTLVATLPDRVYVKDTEGRYVLNNFAHARALGAVRPEDAAGKSDFDFYPEEVAERHRADEQEIIQSGRPLVNREQPSVDREGNRRWYSTTKVPLRDGNSGIVGLLGMTRDITERKEAEEELHGLQREHEELVDSVDAIIWKGNARPLRFTFVSHQAQTILGYPVERWTAEPSFWRDHIHPEDREWAVTFCRKAIDDKKSHSFEYRMIDADGDVVWLRDIVHVAVESGVPTQLFGVMIDITERKETERKLRESEERFRSLVQNASDLITILEKDGTIRYESPATERILGYRPEERIGKNAFDYLHPDDADRAKATFADALDNPAEVRPPVEFRLYHKDGSWRHMETTRTNLLQDPAVMGVVANSRDVTERKEAEKALRESEERFRSAFEDSPIGVALVDLDGRRFRLNRALCEMLGYSEDELLCAYLEHVHPDDREISSEHLHRLLKEGSGNYTLERRYLHADEHVVWNLTSVSLIQDSRGEPSHLVCLHQDITERKELEERLRHQAFYDSLTDLPNRSLFLDRLGHALDRAGREGNSLAVLLADLDDFKLVNDSLGHDAGNAVLVEVAKRLRRAVRPGDTVGRIFGDEFAILLEAPAGMEEANLVTQRIEERLREPFEAEGQEVYVSPSIGISLGETAENEPKEVLRHADLAMYEAKSRGKAQHEAYNPDMDVRATERMNQERHLRRAIEREEFEIHYQPKVLLETGAIAGVEALVRWQHPERGLLEACQFIQLAEKTGLINQIGPWVLKESCRQLKEWQERYSAQLGLPFGICVNLSAEQIRQPDLTDSVASVLRETGLDPACLMLELSERTAKEDAEQTISKLRELKDLGVKLAIDDFGTGYCSLVYLEHTLLDFLKIDRLLVQRKREDDPEGCRKVISAMTSMAHSLDLAVIVEGIETEEQLANVKEIGCEMAQGYYFARPLPSEAIEPLLREGFCS
jgi:diguanylate cyclase (GGDEF)-like protein/PAS domain S-box-containing protein